MTMQATKPGVASTDHDLITPAPATSHQTSGLDTGRASVPDHVPAEMAAQHPDAASVVAAAAQPAPRGGVRVVSRGDTPRSPARAILGLAACAALATLSAATTPAATATVGAAPSTANPAPTTTAPVSAPTPSCPPGTSVVVRCTPPCPALSPLSFSLANCTPARSVP
jgi:hypothetical protein